MMTKFRKLEIKEIELILEKGNVSPSQENALRQYLKSLKVIDENGKTKQ